MAVRRVLAAPTIKVPADAIRPGTPPYKNALREQKAAVTRDGLPLGYASPALVSRGKEYAHKRQLRFPPWVRRAVKQDKDWLHDNAQGEVAAQLLAECLGGEARWVIYEDDGGWDIVIPGVTLLLDSKSRRRVLTVEDKDLRKHLLRKVDYYLLVQQEEKEPFIWCGAIRPAEFEALTEGRRPMQFGPGEPLCRWVTAAELTVTPLDFLDLLEELRGQQL